MPIVLRSQNLSSPDLVLAGLYDDVLYNALRIANGGNIDVSHHLYHLALLLRDVLNLGYKAVDFGLTTNEPVFILFDCPSRRILKFLLTRFTPKKIILILAEHPAYQPNHLFDIIRDCSCLIHSYELGKENLPSISTQTITSFAYQSIPRIESNAWRNTKRNYDASIFCSNLVFKPPSLYAFRRHLINAATVTMDSRFAFFGRGWSSSIPHSNQHFHKSMHSIWSKKIKPSLYRYPTINLSRYCGAPATKHSLLAARTAFAIENFLEPSGYTTEKALECLTYGCLPVYVGSTNSNWLSEFLPVRSPDTLQLLSDSISASNSDPFHLLEKVEKIRISINEFLGHQALTSFSRLYEIISNM